MFLIGLSGSLIPYLLFLGMIVVFTFSTNNSALSQDNNQPNEEKKICVLTEINSSQPISTCYNFSNYHLDQKKTFEETDETAVLFKLNEFSLPPIGIATSTYIPPRYTTTFISRYFGLSPPIMV